ncbi:hypothetical protein Slala05_02770 [Streptomyces lavendulae subsp. lavendulae]|nr:hypothetical protein Slala05_02770 [Streptomyces lavendulae subsp. lavendulae]
MGEGLADVERDCTDHAGRPRGARIGRRLGTDILCDMIPTPAEDRAAELNERIRALVAVGQAGSDEYQALLREWLRATVVPAA